MNDQEYIKSIKELMNSDLDKALSECDVAVEKFPNVAELYYLKALILWNKSEVFNVPREEFSALLKQATDLDPHYSAPHKLWAYANELLGYPGQALLGYTRAMEANPNDYEAKCKVGELKIRMGDFEEGVKILTETLPSIKQPSDRIYNFLGHAKRNLKKYDEAIKDFNKAIEINPKAGGSLWGSALCKKEMEDWQGAMEDLTKMIEIFPTATFEPYMERADVALKINDLVSALQDYQKAADMRCEEALQKISDLQLELFPKITRSTQFSKIKLQSGKYALQISIDGKNLTFVDILGTNYETDEKLSDEEYLKKILNQHFILACRLGKTEKVKELLSSGADIKTLDEYRNFPLFVAIQNNRPEIVKVLLEAKVDLNYKNDRSQNAVIFATTYNKPEILEILLQAGAPVDEQDSSGQTALMHACKLGKETLVKLLLDAKAQTALKDKFARTALALAKQANNAKIIQLLESAGVNE